MTTRDIPIYAIYKGDEFIDLGTKEYLAQKLNIKVNTVLFYASKKYKNRINTKRNINNRIIAIRCDENAKEVS